MAVAAWVAVEHSHRNLVVTGSSPVQGCFSVSLFQVLSVRQCLCGMSLRMCVGVVAIAMEIMHKQSEY